MNDEIETIENKQKRRKEARQQDKANQIERKKKLGKGLFIGMAAVLLSSMIINSSNKEIDYSSLPASMIYGSGHPAPIVYVTEKTIDYEVPVVQEESIPEPKVIQGDIGLEIENSSENIFNFDPEVWSTIEKLAPEYDLPVSFVAAIVMTESNGNASVKSADGYNSYGLMQPSLNYHFTAFAPYLEQTGLLSELTSKSADSLTPQDNSVMLANYQNMDSTWKSKQDIEAILCSPEVNLRVGLSYLSSLNKTATKKYPEMTQQDRLLLSSMAYNGGPGALEVSLTGEDHNGWVKNIRNYKDKVIGFWPEYTENEKI